MAMSEDVEAKKLGERLLVDVRVEGLSEVLGSLRTVLGSEDTITFNTLFNIPELDALTTSSPPTILELISPPTTHHPSGTGKTSLLYLIIAQAILPPSTATISDVGGHNAAVIILDPLHHISIPRVAHVILNHLISKLSTPIDTLDTNTKTSLLALTTQCLDHVHIFHPSSWPSLLATLRSLPAHLFSPAAHKSAHRRVHSLLLPDIDAFTWSIRGQPSHPNANTTPSSNPLTAASSALTNEIRALTSLLSCTAVLTSASTTPSSFRAPLPLAWPAGLSVTRLAVRRVEVVKFAPGMSVEQAEGEKGQRWEVVRRGRFECWKVGGSGGEGTRGEGFVFRVREEGVEIERKEGEEEAGR